jgi:hypothetical protein
LNTDDKNKFKMTGEESTLSEPFTYNEAIKAPDADEWVKVMVFE